MPPVVRIPNRNVGPVALRQRYRAPFVSSAYNAPIVAPTGLRLDVAGVDVLPSVTDGSLHATNTGYRMAGVMTFRAESALGGLSILSENEVHFRDGDIQYYAGLVKTATPVAELCNNGWRAYDVECQDFTVLPSFDIIDVELSALTDIDSYTDKQLIALAFSTFGTKGVIIGTECQVLSTHVALGAMLGNNLGEFMDALCALTGGAWYVDYYRHLHYFLTESELAPFSVTDVATADWVSSFPHDQLVLPEDTIDLHNAVFYIPAAAGEGVTAVPTWYTDPVSIAEVAARYGDNGRREASVTDASITDQATLDAYGAAFLRANGKKRVGTFVTWQPGLRGGMTLLITSADDGLTACPFAVQAVDIDYNGITQPIFTVTFGDQPVTFSAFSSSTAVSAVKVLPQVDAAIANAVAADFANGLVKIPIVNSLPSPMPDPLYPTGQPIVLTTDRKMYISTGTGWECKVDGANIVASTVTAAAFAATIVLAGAVMTASDGARCEMSKANGFVAYDSTGAIRMQIPITDDPISILAAIQATNFTSTGSAEFQAAVSFGKTAIATWQSGIQPPNAAPTVLPIALAPTGSFSLPMGYDFGDAYPTTGYYDPAAGADGATACWVTCAYDRAGGTWYVLEYELAGYTLSRQTAIATFAGLTSISGINRIGANWFLAFRGQAGPSGFTVQGVVRATGAHYGSPADKTFFNANNTGGMLASDGATYLYLIGWATSYTTAKVYKITASTGATAATITLALPAAPSGGINLWIEGLVLADVGDGNGSALWAQYIWNDGSGFYKSADTVWQFNATSGANIPHRDFASADQSNPQQKGGLAWDGSAFREVSWQTWNEPDETQCTFGICTYPSLDWTTTYLYWRYAWLDDVGTTHETAMGPARAISTGRRRAQLIGNSPIPGAGGADDPDKVEIFAAAGATDPGPGNYHLQTVDALTSRAVSSYNGAGSADGSGTAFPGGTGGIAQSTPGAAGLGWSLNGRGDVAFGGLAMTPAGAALLAAIGASMNQLGANVTMTSANTFYSGPSATLSPGIWILWATVLISGRVGAAGQHTVKLWDGTNVGASTEVPLGDSAVGPSGMISCVVVVASGTPTWTCAVAANGTGAKILAAAPVNGAGNNASTLMALRIA